MKMNKAGEYICEKCDTILLVGGNEHSKSGGTFFLYCPNCDNKPRWCHKI